MNFIYALFGKHFLFDVNYKILSKRACTSYVHKLRRILRRQKSGEMKMKMIFLYISTSTFLVVSQQQHIFIKKEKRTTQAIEPQITEITLITEFYS